MVDTQYLGVQQNYECMIVLESEFDNLLNTLFHKVGRGCITEIELNG